MADPTRVWNRAALEGGGAEPRLGDRLLAAVLLTHGLVMNGGVMHALEGLAHEELELARLGYKRLGFGEVAGLLVHDISIGESAGVAADRAYASAVADDGALFDRFRADLDTNPHDYADA